MYLLFLFVVFFVSCSSQRQQMNQIKRSLKKSPYFFLNQSYFDDSRKLLFKEIENFALGSDTIIIYEIFVDVKGSYGGTVYASGKGIKRYLSRCEFNKFTLIAHYLEELKVPDSIIKKMQLIKTDAQSFLNEETKIKTTPSAIFIITIATKEKGKYIFQYFSAHNGLTANQAVKSKNED